MQLLAVVLAALAATATAAQRLDATAAPAVAVRAPIPAPADGVYEMTPKLDTLEPRRGTGGHGGGGDGGEGGEGGAHGKGTGGDTDSAAGMARAWPVAVLGLSVGVVAALL